ncbi:MAG TPA: glycosyltransferase family 2 protein [Candidatus Udaeobacter sp.]|nr:glycosyltransferase family 2 protein [Candidatus Udaeobacter sp.]
MAEESFLADEFLRQLMSVGEVDLLIGIPSYNNASTLGQTLQSVEESLRQNFVRERAVILNVDGGSADETRQIFVQSGDRRDGAHKGLTSLRTIHRISCEYDRSPSQGMALHNIVAAADLLRAKACAVVSPATTNFTPSWVANLLRPVYREGMDFVAPLYVRSRFQGLLARDLLYPMSRAVFGQRIRELYSDEWGFSGRLASQCLEKDVWHEDAMRARPEAWMAITAASSGLKCGQYFLGPKSAAPAGSGPDIVDAIRQTVGNFFWCMETNQAQWMTRSNSQAVATFGPDHELSLDGIPPSPEKIFDLFRSGVSELEPILASILSKGTHSQIKAIALSDRAKFHFAPELWVTTLYEFAASYHHAVLNRDHLVQALVPLYRGRLYSFLLENANTSAEAMEAQSELLCQEFERRKPYLVERWTAKS